MISLRQVLLNNVVLRLQNKPAWAVWGVIILVAWFVLFSLLLIEDLISTQRAEETARRFVEIIKNQHLLIEHVDQFIEPVKQMLNDDKIMLQKITEQKDLWQKHVEGSK